MRVMFINSFFSPGGPPRIVKGIYDTLTEQGHDCLLAASRGSIPDEMKTVKIGTTLDNYTHLAATRILDRQAFSSSHATRGLINEIEKYKPDVVNIHNLHGYYINCELLFSYLKTTGIPIVLTLHDCWTFTGHCAHFDYVGCTKWQTGCGCCPNKKEYPTSLFTDNSAENYKRKKAAFTGVKNLTVTTPSEWLAGLAGRSFLSEYPVRVINNGVDLREFKPVDSDFREKHNLKGKKIVLAAALNWGQRKGFDDFLKLCKHLDGDFTAVMLGLTDKQLKTLPSDIIGLPKTDSIRELCEIYTAADVFVNPTLEEVFGLVNIEALACGTPVITYATGGSPECIDETCGVAVSPRTPDALAKAVAENIGRFTSDSCIKRAAEFDMRKKYREYLELFKTLANK